MNVKDQIPLISKNNHLNLNINGYISMFFVVVFFRHFYSVNGKEQRF